MMLRDVPIAFADVPPFKLFGLADEPALLLGTDILETFRRVSLDFRARKVRFQLRRCGTEGVVISTEPRDIHAHLGDRRRTCVDASELGDCHEEIHSGLGRAGRD